MAFVIFANLNFQLDRTYRFFRRLELIGRCLRPKRIENVASLVGRLAGLVPLKAYFMLKTAIQIEL
jgi:hypothetical protein